MWADLQTEIQDRILASRQFFLAVAGPPGTIAPPIPPHALTTAKGLMFVQLYSVYEFTIIGIVREALAEIKTRATPINLLRLELLGIVLNAQFNSAKDCKPENAWANRIELFCRTNAVDPAVFDETLFPNDGSHFHHRQILTIWQIFGIS